MISIEVFVFNPFQENTYVVYDETREAAIVDPGCSTPAECSILDQFIADKKLTVTHLLNTHCHIDHVLGNDHVKEKYKAPLLIHRIEEQVLRAVKSYASNYGFPSYREALADGFLEEGQILKIGNSEWKILFLPGHSPGHVGFLNEKEKVILSGDVLFEGSIGRTDLPGGNFQTLIKSIHEKLFVLHDDIVVYAGHGDTTTLGAEKTTNPFCALSLHS